MENNQITENDKFLLVMVKTLSKKLKWIVLLFAIATIATIGIQTTKINELNKTIEEMQLYIKKLEFNSND